MNKLLSALLLGLTPLSAALAHEGHGPEGPHWHATDTLGFVLAAVVIVLAVWLARK